jgi:cytochrome c553
MNRQRNLVVFAVASLVAGVAAHAGDFIDLRRMPSPGGDAAAGKSKATTCAVCHGANGLSAGAVFPNLAGQHEEYLYERLVEFKREMRPESVMTSQVGTLDDAAMRDLAAYFASLPPALAPPGASTTSRGAVLYRDGDPARGTPPCQGCHGADAMGHPWADRDPAYGMYPALRGQRADYLVRRLGELRDGTHDATSADRVMTPVAKTLDDASIAAVSAWLDSGR